MGCQDSVIALSRPPNKCLKLTGAIAPEESECCALTRSSYRSATDAPAAVSPELKRDPLDGGANFLKCRFVTPAGALVQTEVVVSCPGARRLTSNDLAPTCSSPAA